MLVSGIVGIDPNTCSLAGNAIQDQTRQALENCQAILQAGVVDLDLVVEVGILLTNPADFAGLNEEYARWFPSGPPTRYVAKLGVELLGLLVLIRMTAFTGCPPAARASSSPDPARLPWARAGPPLFLAVTNPDHEDPRPHPGGTTRRRS